MKLYESRAVGDAGAEAIARGNEIAFAPGMADFSTKTGQERLGHELSHVMSQRSGAVRGEGFLVNSALEARADREGAMAAAGEPVYTGPVTHALSSASPAPAAAGPMQAKRGGGPRRTEEEEFQDLSAQRNPGASLTRAGGLNKTQEKRWQKLNKNRWKRMQKSMSKGDFYDKVENSLFEGGGVDVPSFARDWYRKHYNKRSRFSGKKGWGPPPKMYTTLSGAGCIDDDDDDILG